MSREHRPHPRFLAQAEIEPLDVDGVRAVTVGTIAWAVAFLALLPFADRLREAGADWWLWVCLTGVGLGLVGLTYCRWRRSRLRGRAGLEARGHHGGPAGAGGGADGADGTRTTRRNSSGRSACQRGVGSVSS